MKLNIVLTKDVVDQEEGAVLYDRVVEFMAQFPEVQVKGTVSNHFELEEPDS